MKKIKAIGVLTSGGDAPGMNAAIRAVVRTAITNGIRVYGIKRGYNGLYHGDMFEMNLRSVSDIINRGGTILYTARSKEFNSPEGVLKAKEQCEKAGLDAIVCIGGDGTFRGALDLSRVGVPCVGIPGTIDNDIGCSEYTIGYDTAMNSAMDMMDKIRDTAQSHDRCSVIEVMGRRAGYIAVNTGIACGASAICIPEHPFSLEKDFLEKVRANQKTGKRHFIVLVAEGVGGVQQMAEEIEAKTVIETRATILGHVQRGGAPSLRDRVVASQMGYHAVKLLLDGKGGRIVAMQSEKIIDLDIEEALATKKTLDPALIDMNDEISI